MHIYVFILVRSVCFVGLIGEKVGGVQTGCKNGWFFSGEKGLLLGFFVFLQADISRDFGTTIRQVRAEVYRLSTTAARISRQTLRVEIGMREHR